MFIEIISHTPVWVWGLLTGLVWLGQSQARPHEISLTRATVLPLVMLALSASGVLSAFGHFPIALGGWAAGVGVAFAFARNAIAVRGAKWSAETRTLKLPGSWLPLALMLGIFATKFFVGVNLAMHPALAIDPVFAGGFSLVYGTFSGVFLARGMSLRSLATSTPRLQSA